MDNEHFGTCLRRARESRGLSPAEVAGITKVPCWMIQSIDAGRLDGLPADVFVRGFIRSYARAVGLGDEPLTIYDRSLTATKRPANPVDIELPPMLGATGPTEDDGLVPRRGVGLAVFVIILLLLATITLSLLLRQPPPSGEGLSQTAPPPAALTQLPAARNA